MKLVRKFIVSREELLNLLGISEESRAEVLYLRKEGNDYAIFVQGGPMTSESGSLVPHWDLDIAD
jgi:hypothetical protein